MNNWDATFDRRKFLRAGLGGGVLLGAAAFTVRGVFAEQLALARTPRMTEGPFYPDKLPLDTDNDLIIINDSVTPAVGDITHLTGRILSTSGEPMKDVVIEIWQCDAHAVYINTRDSGPKKNQQDKNFQGFGRFTTNAKGEYRFRTIKPVPYPGRPAGHIHIKIKKGDRELLTTHCSLPVSPATRTTASSTTSATRLSGSSSRPISSGSRNRRWANTRPNSTSYSASPQRIAGIEPLATKALSSS